MKRSQPILETVSSSPSRKSWGRPGQDDQEETGIMAEAEAVNGEPMICRPLQQKNRFAAGEHPGKGTKAHLEKPVERRDHQLAPDLRPKQTLEYVIAHDICHLKHRNHSNNQWRLRLTECICIQIV